MWATALSRKVTATAVEIPANVGANVLPANATLEIPVAFVKSKVDAAVTTVAVTVSIELIVAGATEPFTTANNSSVPSPPLRRSPEFSVCRLVLLRPASNVSSADVPVKVFVPAVNVNICAVTATVSAVPNSPPALPAVCDNFREAAVLALKEVA